MMEDRASIGDRPDLDHTQRNRNASLAPIHRTVTKTYPYVGMFSLIRKPVTTT